MSKKEDRYRLVRVGDREISMPRVTAVLDCKMNWALVEWKVKLALGGEDPDKVSQEAADFGSQIHAFIDDFLAGHDIHPDELIEPYKTCFFSFLDWYDGNKFDVAAVEEQVYHPEHLYCGKVDMVGRYEGGLLLADWKTSKGLWNNYAIQAVAYKKAYEALHQTPVNKLIIVRLPKFVIGKCAAADCLNYKKEIKSVNISSPGYVRCRQCGQDYPVIPQKVEVLDIPPEKDGELFEVFLSLLKVFRFEEKSNTPSRLKEWLEKNETKTYIANARGTDR